MTDQSTQPRCRFCERKHAPTHLCPPAKQVLDALLERGMSFDMPTLEFPDAPMPPMPSLGEPGDTLLAQLVVQGAVVDVGEIPRAALVFTGRDATSKPLPRWLYVANDDQIEAAAQLVADMSALAVRTAQARRAP